MEPTTMTTDEMRERTLQFASNPDLWLHWPFLPLVRRTKGEEELGLLYDTLHAKNLPGFSSTVFKANLFLLPNSVEEFLALPKEVFDTWDELVAAGWTVD